MNTNLKEKADRAYEIAYNHNAQYGHCPHCTIRSLHEVYEGKVDKDIFRALGVFSGGGALEGDGTCGAYVAGLFFLSSKFGINFDEIANDVSDSTLFRNGGEPVLYPLAKELHEKFINEYGSIVCHQIHRELYGRPYYLADDEEHEKLKELLSTSKITGCPAVCGNAAKWTVEIYENFINK